MIIIMMIMIIIITIIIIIIIIITTMAIPPDTAHFGSSFNLMMSAVRLSSGSVTVHSDVASIESNEPEDDEKRRTWRDEKGQWM